MGIIEKSVNLAIMVTALSFSAFSQTATIQEGRIMVNSQYEVLIIGGSHAGLSAAMALGRMQRNTLIVDAGKPRNSVAEHANNIAGLDGINPDKWRMQAREDLAKYPTITFLNGRVTRVDKVKNIFKAQLASGEVVEVRKVILAYGIKDNLPEIEGIWEFWGKAVFHCPFCHGYEVRNRNLGIVGNGEYVEHMLPMIASLSKKVTVFTQGKSGISELFMSKMKKHNIPVVETPIAALEKSDNELKSVRLKNGGQIEIDALFVAPTPPLVMNSTIGKELGCKTDEIGFIEVGLKGNTSVEGVFAAGDIMTMQHSVIGALSTGQRAGSGVVFELVHEDFEKMNKQ